MRQILTSEFFRVTFAVTLIQVMIWSPSYTKPLDNITLATIAAEKSWLFNDTVVKEYLRNSVQTEYEFLELTKTRFYEKSPKNVITMSNPPIYEHGFKDHYHEPVLVCRRFYFYKYAPETRPYGKNWIIFGFLDTYGKIVVIAHWNAEYVWIV